MNRSVFRQQNKPFCRNLKPQFDNQWGHQFPRFINQDSCFADRLLSHVQTFEAGCVILEYTIPEGAEAQPVATSRQANAYFVLHGQVRIFRPKPAAPSALLCVSTPSRRTLLELTMSFVKRPLSYQAVAATTCQVVQVPYSYLSFWIDQHPRLRSYWSSCLEQRIQQLFFKTIYPPADPAQPSFGQSVTLAP